ncbi:MAG TPA: hypothetical protein VHO91_19375, partial [Rhodopila sp.]|nr:hypothetical protein [Rhodopila sp.]
DFNVTVTFCFTPEHKGVWPHYTAPPQDPAEFADFCAAMIRRYAGGGYRPAEAAAPTVEAADAFEKADVAGPD